MRKSGRAYHLTFFCRSGQENGPAALASFLSKLTETGDPVLVTLWSAIAWDEISGFEVNKDAPVVA